ncbi:molybdopterin-dependent oxidoreductase [Actinokineospora fastidiosa]|uniref:Molybdopterin-binding oxidoreductase n=1 Tax=Actinokineospora fastidiosa TaxID=1816 RepID=A0A918G6T4_9PSEU|nr:molybdopterin-dependent oxidoreductase [Actinokineospora fastidiosa]GGS20372.1 molybdopterin-binding oxidoreductase [Actinokineospora fastidiosa]
MPTHHVTCPLCEATCGLSVTVDDGAVTSVRGDALDVFSRGYLCPKGASIGSLHGDPDRVRAPLVKRGGRFVEVAWDEAFAEIAARLPRGDAAAVYLGNPGVHNLSTSLYARALIKALDTKNVYSASSVDQAPKQFAAGYLFGDPMSVPVPDLDRTDFLLLLGANPLVSNGSLMTSPDTRGRLRAIRARGGRVVVVDPMRSRTAESADQHLAIRPGTDALLLFALVHVLFAEDLVKLGALAPHVAGVDAVRALAVPFSPEAVAPATGLSAEAIRGLAADLAAAPTAAVYGRIGTTAQRFGSLASWLVDVLNVLTGNLDRPGGAMFPLAAAGQANAGRGRRPFRHGRWHSRVRGLPEVMGELPAATLADEIEAGGVRALVTLSGNPCVSTPNADRLAEALRGLDFMVSLDIYVNETTRHADVILPGTSPLERPHYDIALYQFAVRNVANWSDAVLETPLPQEWETLLRMTGAVVGMSDVDALDDVVAAQVASRFGVPVAEGRGPARLVDMMLRAGPYDVRLADLRAHPHGIDFGPLKPRVPEVLATESGRIELAPPALTADVPRLLAELTAPVPPMVLIGRRQLRSNNSWMHNIAPLMGGANRCTAQLNPTDAERLGLTPGDPCVVRSRTGKVTVPIEITDAIRPGVVSIPHGWGHTHPDTHTTVAAEHPGVNSNILADELLIDAPSGTAVLNGIPVEVTRA